MVRIAGGRSSGPTTRVESPMRQTHPGRYTGATGGVPKTQPLKHRCATRRAEPKCGSSNPPHEIEALGPLDPSLNCRQRHVKATGYRTLIHPCELLLPSLFAGFLERFFTHVACSFKFDHSTDTQVLASHDTEVLNASGVRSLDWNSYPILKFPDLPELDIVLINRPDVASLGAGELSTVPIPAAIANAIFDATGIRLREVPFTPNRILAGLQQKS